MEVKRVKVKLDSKRTVGAFDDVYSEGTCIVVDGFMCMILKVEKIIINEHRDDSMVLLIEELKSE